MTGMVARSPHQSPKTPSATAPRTRSVSQKILFCILLRQLRSGRAVRGLLAKPGDVGSAGLFGLLEEREGVAHERGGGFHLREHDDCGAGIEKELVIALAVGARKYGCARILLPDLADDGLRAAGLHDADDD